MSFQQKGTLLDIMDEQQVSEKFRKREFVLEIPGQYPEHVKFQLVQDKCSAIDGFRLGDEVNVSFSLRGRGFNKDGQMLYYNNLDAWKVEATGNTPQPRPNVPAPRVQNQVPLGAGGMPHGNPDHDLPF